MTIMDIFGRENKVVRTSGSAPETKEVTFEDRLFDLVKKNEQVIGHKTYACIPLELLKVDGSYQRTDTYDVGKVKDLTAKFDITKMDTLMVSVHTEEKRFYIIDGMHRFLAAKANGFEELECEILDLSDDPEERRKEEAKRFIVQQDMVDKMSPLDQHKGHVVLGDEEYKALDEVVNNTEGIFFKKNRSKGRQSAGTLTGYAEAIKITKWYGKKHIQDVLDTLVAAHWNCKGTGLSNMALRSVSNVLVAHHNNAEVKAECARVLRNWEPKLFQSVAQGHYPTRSMKNASTLYLEDFVCNNLNIPRLIDPEVKERYNPDTVA